MNDNNKPVDFDEYVQNYEDIMQKQLAFFSKDRSFFSKYKVDLIADLCQIHPTRIIDFGCGIGLSLPHLINRFPDARIYATDLSMKSLAYVRSTYPNIHVLTDDQLDGCTFDLIFVSAVFHHIPIAKRPMVLKRLAGFLTEKGTLCIFEHNPYNPVTRHMVATCLFDTDAELIELKNMRKLINNTGLTISHYGYSLFFPQGLQLLRLLEKAITWLPLGGQYFVTARNLYRPP